MEEEVLEQLRAVDSAGSFPVDLPTEDDVLTVEEELLISIPRDLRRFLLEASDVVYGTIETVTASDPRAHTYLPEIAAYAWDGGLPRELIPVAMYDSGYAATAADGKIVFWIDGNEEEEWDDLWRWCWDAWLRQ